MMRECIVKIITVNQCCTFELSQTPLCWWPCLSVSEAPTTFVPWQCRIDPSNGLNSCISYIFVISTAFKVFTFHSKVHSLYHSMISEILMSFRVLTSANKCNLYPMNFSLLEEENHVDKNFYCPTYLRHPVLSKREYWQNWRSFISVRIQQSVIKEDYKQFCRSNKRKKNRFDQKR